MIKKILLIISICLVLLFSILYTVIDFNKKTISLTEKIESKVSINKEKLNVTYLNGNLIDSNISFGNKIDKEILIENKNKEDIIYALKFLDVNVNCDNLFYSLSYKLNEEDVYQELSNGKLTGNTNLGYNLVIKAKSKMYLKITISSKNEIGIANISGKFEIASNLSSNDIFASDLTDIHNKVLSLIDEKNGISEQGEYYLNLDNIKKPYKGYVLIDAKDISELNFYYYVCDDLFCLYNYKYHKEFNKSKLEKYSEDLQNKININEICKSKKIKKCLDFNDLKKDNTGGMKKFNQESLDLIKIVKDDFIKRNKENKIYIYDVLKDINNTTNIRGYILIDNRKNAEYYVYLTDNKYMVSGYNITKLGDYSTTSNTIRQYRESAFNLSSENISTVCTFTKLGECLNINDQKV